MSNNIECSNSQPSAEDRESISDDEKHAERQHLLTTGQQSAPTAIFDEERNQIFSSTNRYTILFWFVVPSIALCLTILVALWSLLTLSDSGHIDSASRTIRSGNYVLDRNWNFNAGPQRREYHWIIEDQIHNPDGIYRPMILVNGQFPGPLIEANEDDSIVVHVENQAVNATSIHWHGIYQDGTPYMDGTVGVTQCK